MQLEIEIEAIKREKDETKLKSLRSDLANLKESRNVLNAKWKSEKELVDNIQNTKQNIENYKLEADRAERDGDYGKVAELRYGKIKEAQDKLEDFQKLLQIVKNTFFFENMINGFQMFLKFSKIFTSFQMF